MFSLHEQKEFIFVSCEFVRSRWDVGDPDGWALVVGASYRAEMETVQAQ